MMKVCVEQPLALPKFAKYIYIYIYIYKLENDLKKFYLERISFFCSYISDRGLVTLHRLGLAYRV